jgi:hypothetical protein
VQTVDPINTIPLQQFIQQVKSADASRSKDIRIPIDQAKNLAFTLGIVMSRLQGDLEKLVVDSKNNNEEVIEVNIGGSSTF